MMRRLYRSPLELAARRSLLRSLFAASQEQ